MGQPYGGDLALEIRQQPIPGTHLQIPKNGVEGTRAERRTTPSGEGQWKKQESLTHDQSAIREGKGSSWKKFNGKGQLGADFVPAGGTIGINANQSRPTQPPKQRLKNWSEHAAKFEERVRDAGDKVGINSAIDLPGGDTSPTLAVARRSTRRNHRRAFTLG